ncbi:MAG: GspH/FimT family protein [Pseudomonadales bacterium]|jgi:type IV fimbrial biogenesis protein FimT|nr:GspH/FimT family protein [Pseudomonadales bacterium]
MSMRGYTLIELLVTLAIAAVVVRAATVEFPHMLATWTASARINAIIGAVQTARHTAIVHRTNATLCPGIDRCGHRNHWHEGALVFTDHNANRRVDGADKITARLPAMRGGERIYWRAFRNRSYLLFRANGLTDWQNGHFQYCPPDGDPLFSRQIIVNATGRVRHAHDRNGDGIPEDARGKALRC